MQDTMPGAKLVANPMVPNQVEPLELEDGKGLRKAKSPAHRCMPRTMQLVLIATAVVLFLVVGGVFIGNAVSGALLAQDRGPSSSSPTPSSPSRPQAPAPSPSGSPGGRGPSSPTPSSPSRPQAPAPSPSGSPGGAASNRSAASECRRRACGPGPASGSSYCVDNSSPTFVCPASKATCDAAVTPSTLWPFPDDVTRVRGRDGNNTNLPYAGRAVRRSTLDPNEMVPAYDEVWTDGICLVDAWQWRPIIDTFTTLMGLHFNFRQVSGKATLCEVKPEGETHET